MAAAVALADESGLGAVTIRGVAARLGVAPMTMYGHVAGAEELVDLVVGATIAAAVDRRLPDRPWDGRGALTGFAHGLRGLLLEHPAVLDAYRRRPVQDPTGLAVTEAVVAALLADGVDEAQAVRAYAGVYAYVVGFVSLERRPVELDRVDLDGLPNLRRVERHLPDLFGEAAFEQGLAALVDAVLPPAPARTRRSPRGKRS